MKSLHLNMKLIVSLFLLQVAIFTSFGQHDSISKKRIGVEVGLQHAYRKWDEYNQKSAQSIDARLTFGKWMLGSQLGTEKWFAVDNWPENNGSAKTRKIELFGGKRIPLFRSNWSMAINYGFRFYVKNQVKDNIYLTSIIPTSNAAQNFGISYVSDTYVNGLKTYSGDLYGIGKEKYYYVLKMPFSHFFRFELSYQWKGISLSAAYTPYWVHMRVKNVVKETSQYNLNKYFYDVSFSLSYRFQHKH